MNNEVEMKIREIIKESLKLDICPSQIDLDADLDGYGINSISIIKIITEIEKTFNIEFDIEELDFKKYQNIRSIILYLEKKLNK
ncbi:MULTISPECIES: phosphopantetheine-binding protein [Clostridium]|uniref:phosphopantetheine-binding protein n=1 Tax=Clostridium TaxID=1485 RepID=UPI0006961D0E|nr:MULTISPECIES: phosphopantetheine-binding protein [Clostridium]AXB85808.1 acyl carrier protein [Clostridium butyricum]MBO1685689.1 acyl carrier protein [Clostridium butyricum]MBS4842604.1 acyl carrier protein [Clostridium sp.]MDB2136575.1 phosphopantetheine-binding protein [Clostridium butyricum]MDB2157834.1 phosphopantetheine-binding protein [Clostridium butyricum]